MAAYQWNCEFLSCNQFLCVSFLAMLVLQALNTILNTSLFLKSLDLKLHRNRLGHWLNMLNFMNHNNQYKSPAIKVYGYCRWLLPWLRVPCWFFCNPALKNCWHGWPGIEPTTLDLSSQSGAYDLSCHSGDLVTSPQ